MDEQILCKNIQPQISEFVDGTLPPEVYWRLQGHLARCVECGQLARDLQNNKAQMQALPRQQTSANFESQLAARLAAAQSQRRRKPWFGRLAGLLPPAVSDWPRQARAAGLALSAAAVIIAGVADLSFNTHRTAPPTGPFVSPGPSSQDQSLVSHCLQQHSRYVAAQPLSDSSAQNLISRLDNNALSSDDIQTGSDAGSL